MINLGDPFSAKILACSNELNTLFFAKQPAQPAFLHKSRSVKQTRQMLRLIIGRASPTVNLTKTIL